MTSGSPPPTPQSPSIFLHSLLAGALAGTSVDTLFFPLDTLKTRLQSSSGFFPSGGFSGVYRGLGSAVVGSAPGAAVFFTTYETLKDLIPRLVGGQDRVEREGWAPLLHMAAASGGEVAACLIRVPTEVVKQLAQTGNESTRSLHVAKKVWARAGVRGFYRGFGSTVAREIPFTCIQFPLYEHFKVLLARNGGRTASGEVKDLPAIEAAACASIAGGIAAGLTTPLDVCKTRIMLSGREATTPTPLNDVATKIHAQTRSYPTSLPATMRIIFREEGIRVLFSGVVPRVLWISFGGAVFLGVYEKAKQVLASNGQGRTRGERGE